MLQHLLVSQPALTDLLSEPVQRLPAHLRSRTVCPSVRWIFWVGLVPEGRACEVGRHSVDSDSSALNDVGGEGITGVHRYPQYPTNSTTFCVFIGPAMPQGFASTPDARSRFLMAITLLVAALTDLPPGRQLVTLN